MNQWFISYKIFYHDGRILEEDQILADSVVSTVEELYGITPKDIISSFKAEQATIHGVNISDILIISFNRV
ncbi:hypothetical protein [Citrobacter koseri]|uniref:hypothetical protein n=1 Tax=Citrobacter koseri TaxID=545 RepID=UPI001906D787|nr:hypothetical protein [Citrobacter koseri]MBJ8938558.1 hypothetical protein [Citrobacter koseri]